MSVAFKKYCVHGNINEHHWVYLLLDYKMRGEVTRRLKTRYERLSPKDRKQHTKFAQHVTLN